MNYESQKIKQVKSFARRGFTILELLVVMAIVVIMTAVYLANRGNDQARADVDNATRQVASQIRALQNESLSGKQINGVSVSQYQFIAASNATSYTIRYVNSSGTELAKQDFDLPKERVRFVSNFSLSFTPPRGDVSIIGGTSPIVLRSISGSSINEYVCVESSTGNVTEQKTSVCP